MGFEESWVALIMECITTITYSSLVNGDPNDLITPLRGLQHRDPLSSYFFLFCAEGLNALLSNAAMREEIRGFSLYKNGLVDDCLLFCRSTLEECNKIQELLG